MLACPPPPSPVAAVRTPARKRPRDEVDSAGRDSGEIRSARSVRFSHIDIRMHGTEIWGGGGVPADDGPPLGLSWSIESERRVELEDFEEERLRSRTPKDAYCVSGCVAPSQRMQMLLRSGSTHRQINSVKKEVAKLNRDRWQVSCSSP